MIYCLTGKIVKKSMNAVVLSCGGVPRFRCRNEFLPLARFFTEIQHF